MSATETLNHCRLKSLTLAWAQRNGFVICGLEVRVPRCGYRADVAGCGRGAGARVAVFECKQARSDLLKDAHVEAATRQRLVELTARRRTLEELLAVHRPDLRRGETLFPEFDAWDFAALEHQGYRELLGEIATVQKRILRGTKFSRMFRYRCADFLYLVVEDAIFAEAEIPAGWGLLVRRGDALQLARPPANLDATMEQRRALLESIALAGTRAVNQAAGVVLPVRASRKPALLGDRARAEAPRYADRQPQ